MKTYQIYTADGKGAGSVEGDDVSVGANVIVIRAGGKVVAVIPIGGFAIVAR